MTTGIQGFCENAFLPLREAFQRNFADRFEVGASVAATCRGRTVVDLWAGHCDPARQKPWTRDTIVPVASTTKAMAVLAFLFLIDRAQIDLDERVSAYWPEFAAGGKEAVTVRDALTHQAGVPGFREPVGRDTLFDWDAITGRLAAEPHWFGGARRICYHFHTFSYLIGELFRRIDGRRLAEFFRQEIAARADVDFHIGLSSPEQVMRVATPVIDPALLEMVRGQADAVMGAVDIDGLSPAERLRLETGGVGNARAIARAGAIIANGGVLDGVRYLKPETIALARQEHARGRCPYLGWIRFGLGLALDSSIFPAPSASCLHWGGLGGSEVIMDPRAGVSFAFTPNNWAKLDQEAGSVPMDRRLARYFDALSQVLKALGDVA